MKRSLFIVTLVLVAFLAQTIPSFADRPLENRKDSHFSATLRGGYFFPEDDVYKDYYGQWSNDIYFLEFGYYATENLLALASFGGYYQRGQTLGELTGDESDEDLNWTSLYFELGASYRFRFRYEQLFVPFVKLNYVAFNYHEDADPGPKTEGWEHGAAPMGGVLILLNNIDPQAAVDIKRRYGVEKTYFELTGRYNFVGESGGINMRGLVCMMGISFDF